MRIAQALLALYPLFAAKSAQATGRELQFGDMDIPPFARGPPSSVPSHVLEMFLEKNQVKRGQTLHYQQVGGNTVEVAGITVSLDSSDLIPINVMVDGAPIRVDGVETYFPALVFQSKRDPSVTITKNKNGQLLSATKRGQGIGPGVNLDVLPLADGTFVTVDKEDIDEDLLASFSYEAGSVPGIHRHLRISKQGTQERSLAVFDVVELDVFADTTFCNAYGGSTSAVAKVQSVVVEAGKFYEVHGIKIQIKSITMECSGGTVSDMVSSNSVVCGSDPTLLSAFRDYVAGQSLTCDLAHLFHGKDFAGGTIGCAYEGNVLCWAGYNTGVDEITFSGTLLNQALLVAHEMGHNMAASHVSGSIMAATLCNCQEFAPSSVTSILQSIATAPSGCIHQEEGTAQPTIPPTAMPTAAPTTRKPTAAPTTKKPTAAPTTKKPTAAPTTKKPTAAPTTAKPTTAKPTPAPTTAKPTTAAPTTAQPTPAPTTPWPTTAAPTTEAPTTAAPTTPWPTTAAPVLITSGQNYATEAPSVSPTTSAAPTTIPITTIGCGVNKASCSSNTDCCSFNCKGGLCKGNRRLAEFRRF